jgi:peptidoglycan DL-endopeptidase LytE
MRRRIFLWMGLIVLFSTIGFSRTGQAQVAHQGQSGDARLVSYSVLKGDTLAHIAKKTGVSIAELRNLNRLEGSFLKIGQKLVLHQTRDRDEVSAPNGYTKDALLSELEEEEDGGLVGKDDWVDSKRRAKESESLLGHWTDPDEPKLLVKAAMGFLGAPYRLGGSSVKGIDCSAFVKKIYQIFNITLPRTAFEQSHVGLRIARGELIEGDLLFFNTRRKLGHVGIYIGNNEFVHASSRKRGVRIDSLKTPYFDRRFVTATRLKGNDDGL